MVGHRQTIHIDSQRDVADVREQIGLTTRNQPNGEAQVQSRHGDRDYTCPVCMDEASFSVETNCGHVFCGQFAPCSLQRPHSSQRRHYVCRLSHLFTWSEFTAYNHSPILMTWLYYGGQKSEVKVIPWFQVCSSGEEIHVNAGSFKSSF